MGALTTSVGATFCTSTVNCAVPLVPVASVARTVKLALAGPSVASQLMAPVAASMVAPPGAASSDQVMAPGPSTSSAVAVSVSVWPSCRLCGAIGATTGASATGFTRMLMVAVLLLPPASVTRNTKLSTPLKLAPGV